MKNNKKSDIATWSIVVFCVITMFVLILKQIKTNRVLKANLIEGKLKNESLLTVFNDMLFVQQYNWMVADDTIKNIIVRNYHEKTYPLYDKLKDIRIIFYFNSKMCTPCIKKQFLNLEEIMTFTNKNKIIILYEGASYKYLFSNYNTIFNKKYINNVYVINDSFLTHYNLSNTPVFFLINKQKIIIAAYHSLKATDKPFENFIQFLKSKSL